MVRRSFVALLAVAALAATVPAAAEAQVPVRIRVIQGTRHGQAQVDPRLANQARQLSALAYVNWQLVEEQSLDLQQGRPQFFSAGGESVAVTLQERRGNTVTIEVAVAARNTQSRLTVEKGQRIIHQVTPEKSGAALFVTVLAWP